MSGDAERIEELTAIMHEHGLDEVRVRLGDCTYELQAPQAAAPAGAVAPAAVAAPAAAAAPAAGANVKKVTAPIIGVFYRAPAPGAEQFVEVGERVAVGQVLCILEAMKLMNEITSDYAGVVTRILPENGQIVSLGEDMFWIEP
jgi:acetyl-CoA carboxylase biotin carboxyl carrier protein